DRNRDGLISADEATAVNKGKSEAQQARERAREAELRRQRLEASVAHCNMPSAPRDARFVFVGGGEGRALSNAWIGSQDRVTHVVTVNVKPGPEPLYLVLASEGATIWDVRGATGRIVGLVAHANTAAERSGDSHGFGERRDKPLVGVMGVPRAKIHFTAFTGCLVPPTKQTLEDGSAQEAAALLLGRSADEIGGSKSMGTFTVPAIQHLPDRPVRNAIRLPKKGRGELLWRNVLGDYPAGVAQIDVGSVISPLPVKNYSILPGNVGLAK